VWEPNSVKIIRNDRSEPMRAGAAAERPQTVVARPRITSIVIRFAVLIVAALVVLGLALNR
jgi:hypothetical protein